MSNKENKELNSAAETAGETTEKKKHNFKKLKFGSASAVVLVLVIAIVVVINLMVGLLSKRYPLKVDLTPDKRYELSDESIDVLKNLVSELIIAKNSLVSFATSENSHSGFNEQIEYLESVTTNLHESVMKVRMVPIESVVNKFPRMIRDLSKKLDKQIEDDFYAGSR